MQNVTPEDSRGRKAPFIPRPKLTVAAELLKNTFVSLTQRFICMQRGLTYRATVKGTEISFVVARNADILTFF